MGQTILFIGDSITDCGQREDAERLGNGYVRILRDHWLAANPAAAPKVINRGISGNRVTHLVERWTADVLDHKPDVLSIKVGVNDVWHGLAGRTESVPLERYVPLYRGLLETTRRALPGCRIVLCEPTMIWSPAPAEGNEVIKPYVSAVGNLAREFGLALVPLWHAFDLAKRVSPQTPWAPDGVHPSGIGHMLIAQQWLRATGM